MTPDEIQQLVAESVAAAMAAFQATGNNNEGEGSGNNNGAGQGAAVQGCTYKEFRNCKPINFSGKEGTVGLIQWFEKLESVFRISGCAEQNKVKYATCTLLEGALTWWNTYAQSVGIDAAYELSWEDLRKKMTEEYCPRNELKKLESELWNLKVKGTDLTSYTTRFHELALLCPGMVTPEYKRIEGYIGGLPAQIQGLVLASNPGTIQEAIHMANKQMDQAISQGIMGRKVEEKSSEGKRKWDESQGKNIIQYPSKRQEIVRQAIPKVYIGNQPYCNKCCLHHSGPCTVVCNKCKKVGHMTKNCRIAIPTTKTVAPGACYECGMPGHLRRNCPKLRRQDVGPANGRVYMITNGEDYQDLD